MSNHTAIFICGPTAVGKTAVAIELAQWLGCEILSFDSRQFFSELQIGAAPPSEEELAQAPHHFIGHLQLEDSYNAGDFERDALQQLAQLFEKHQHAILVGGSGLYMKALTEGFDEMPEVDPAIRESLKSELTAKGLDSLLEELKNKDPEYYEKVDRQNPQRVVRALETIRSSGQPYSNFRRGQKAKRPFHIVKIGLEMEREKLYQRINHRVDLMLEDGLEEEAEELSAFAETNALQTVGYREWYPYFKGAYDRSEAIELIKRNSRRYAKRQLTWFKRDKEIQWFEPQQVRAIQDYLRSQLNLKSL